MQNNAIEEYSSREINPDLLFKHPLEHTWSFWYYENNKEKCWEDNQKEVASFSTVEDFWWYDFVVILSIFSSSCFFVVVTI